MSMKLAALVAAVSVSAGATGLAGRLAEALADAPGAASEALAETVGEDAAGRAETAPRPLSADGRDRLVLRVCLGPAQMTFGGPSPVVVSFGAHGCGRDGSALFGVELRSSASGRAALII